MESQNDRLFQWEKHSWSPLSWSFKTIKIILIGYIKSAPLLPQSLMLGMSCSYYETRTFMYIPSGKKDGNVKSPFLHSIPIQSWGFPWFSMVFHCHVCRRISHPFPSWTAISRPQTRHHWAFLSKTDNPWLRAPLKTPQGSHKTRVNIWVCLKIGYIPNYSHLIGIMIINHWV